jgi:hypothetical protein
MSKKSKKPPKASGGRRGPRGKPGALAPEELHTMIRKVEKIQDQVGQHRKEAMMNTSFEITR